MGYSRLFILVEGDDDERFIQRVVGPALAARYDSVEVWKYQNRKKEKTRAFLRSLACMRAHYFYLADINRSPCVTGRKSKLRKALRKSIDPGKAIIVIKEIESWYPAGLNDERMRSLLGKVVPTTDDLTKEQFNALIPRRFDSRVDFMMEVLKSFSPKVAARRNRSFPYFREKVGL